MNLNALAGSVSPGTRLFANESKAMKRPLGLMNSPPLLPFTGEPSNVGFTRIVLGVQPDGAAMQVSRRNTELSVPPTPATILVAKPENGTYRPLALIVGTVSKLRLPLMRLPSLVSVANCSKGVQPAPAPKQVSRM